MRRAVGLLRRAPEVACPGSWPAASQLQSARFATGDESEASSSVTASQSGAGLGLGRGRGGASQAQPSSPGAPPNQQQEGGGAPGASQSSAPQSLGRGKRIGRLLDNLGLQQHQGPSKMLDASDGNPSLSNRNRLPSRPQGGRNAGPLGQQRPQRLASPNINRVQREGDANVVASWRPSQVVAAEGGAARRPSDRRSRGGERGGGRSQGSGAPQPFRSTAGGSRPSYTRRVYAEEPEMTAAELEELRLAYMGLDPDSEKEMFEFAREVQEDELGEQREYEEAIKEVNEENSPAHIQQIIDNATDDSWVQAQEDWNKLKESGWDGEGTVSDKQYELLEQWEDAMEPYTEDDVRAGNVKPEFHTEMINNFSRAMELDYEPAYNFVLGPPKRILNKLPPDPEDVLDAFREQLMAEHGIESHMEFDSMKERVLDGLSDVLPEIIGHDAYAERKALEAKAAEVPKDHPMSIAVEMAVKEIRRNPFWTPEQRELFIGRLVHQAIRPESPESESESERERDDEASE